MGSTGIMTKKDFEDVFIEEFGYMLYNNIVIKYAEVKVPKPYVANVIEESEFYLASRRRNGDIMCDVVIFSRYSDGEVIYKILTEEEGPFCITTCPKEIAKYLTPLSKCKDKTYYADIFRKRHLILK